MSPELKETGGSKQKIIIGVIIVIALVVGWNVIGMFGGGGGDESVPTPTPAPAGAPQPGAGSNNGTTTTSMTAPPAAGGTPSAPIAPSAPPQPEIKQSNVQVNADLLKMQRETQQKYIAALNELQMLRLQREIAETNQAITVSKLA